MTTTTLLMQHIHKFASSEDGDPSYLLASLDLIAALIADLQAQAAKTDESLKRLAHETKQDNAYADPTTMNANNATIPGAPPYGFETPDDEWAWANYRTLVDSLIILAKDMAGTITPQAHANVVALERSLREWEKDVSKAIYAEREARISSLRGFVPVDSNSRWVRAEWVITCSPDDMRPYAIANTKTGAGRQLRSFSECVDFADGLTDGWG